jgi:hypothetical protein
MFRVGVECTIWDRGRVVALVTVAEIKLRWFVTSDGTRWRARVGDEAVRVPEAVDAPTLRLRRASDSALQESQRDLEALEARPYSAPPTGLTQKAVGRAMRALEISRPSDVRTMAPTLTKERGPFWW